jgi:hypothetical protein
MGEPDGNRAARLGFPSRFHPGPGMALNWRQWLKPLPRPRAGSVLSGFLAATIAMLFVVYLYQYNIRLPPNMLPWEPINLSAPPGWIAHWQLDRLASNGQRCRAALDATPEHIVPLKDQRIDDACGFENVVRVDRSPIAFAPRTTAACGLSAALFWYQGLLQQAAQLQMHARLIRIDQLGTFACRNVNSEAAGARSQHATANAIDVAAFHFSDGRVANIAHDYGKDSPEGHFLDAAHDAACAVFNTVLGPRYNRLHATHFHLDMGPYRICS